MGEKFKLFEVWNKVTNETRRVFAASEFEAAQAAGWIDLFCIVKEMFVKVTEYNINNEGVTIKKNMTM